MKTKFMKGFICAALIAAGGCQRDMSTGGHNPDKLAPAMRFPVDGAGPASARLENYRIRPEIPEVFRDLAKRHADTAAIHYAAAVREAVEPLRDIFRKARENTTPFAEEAISLHSKYLVLKDTLPVVGKDEFADKIRLEFGRKFYDISKMEAAIHQVFERYKGAVEEVENRLLVELRLDMDSLPLEIRPSSQAMDAIARSIGEQMRQAWRDSAIGNGKDTLAFLLGSWASGKAATLLAPGGGIIVVATLGAIIDMGIYAIYEQVVDTRGNLAARLSERFSFLEKELIEGDGQNHGVMTSLHRLSANRAVRLRMALEEAFSRRP